MELDRENARETVANFLLHVRSGFYNGLMFHRVRPGFMIQVGALTPDRRKRTSPTFPIANEADNGLLNLRGTVAMARTSDPHSATSEFFINLKDNPMLDYKAPTALEWGYAVFGRVTEGMDVVDAIATSPTERWSIYEAIPLDPIVVDSAFVVVEPTG
jgi:cyclophilin family peptidyl-prolyl cis-trans isomerase